MDITRPALLALALLFLQPVEAQSLRSLQVTLQYGRMATESCPNCTGAFEDHVSRAMEEILGRSVRNFEKPRLNPESSSAAAVRRFQLYGDDLIVGDDQALGIAYDRSVLKSTVGDFSEIDAAFKRVDTRQPTRVMWVGLGWIPISGLGKIYYPGQCASIAWDKVCAEKHGADTYVVKHVEGFEGWPIVGVATSSWNTIASEYEPVRTALVGNLTTGQLGRSSSDYFLVPALDSLRKKRKVTFEMWSTDKRTKLRSSIGDHPLPIRADTSDVQRSEQGGFNACGGVQKACPPYKIPLAEARAMFERMPKPTGGVR